MKFLVLLLIAHIVGDFFLQPTSWVTSKLDNGIKSFGFWNHMGVHAILLLLLYFIFPQFYFPLILVFISHLIIDASKIIFIKNNEAKKNEIRAFLLDQILHVLVIISVAITWNEGIDLTWIHHEKYLWIIFGYLFLSYPSATIISQLLSPYEDDVKTNATNSGLKSSISSEKVQDDTFIHKSLENGGKYIGVIERLLIYTFILIGQWTAVGLLITAKSVFRFGDLNHGRNRQFTEYVLIGTLLSFAMAIIIALVVLHISNNMLD